jgi:hypothetical protein
VLGHVVRATSIPLWRTCGPSSWSIRAVERETPRGAGGGATPAGAVKVGTSLAPPDGVRAPSTNLRRLAAVLAVALAAIATGAPRSAEAQAPAPVNPDCYAQARQRLLADASATRLCRGARTAAPADCVEAAEGKLLVSEAIRITLCRCAVSRQPVRCYDHTLQSSGLSAERVLAICSPSLRGKLDEGCRPPGFR